MRRGKPNEPLIVGRVRPYGPAVGRANHRPELLLAISGEETRFADREAAKLRVRIVKLEKADNRRRIHSDRLLTEEAIKLAARHPLERQVADLQLPYRQQIVLRLGRRIAVSINGKIHRSNSAAPHRRLRVAPRFSPRVACRRRLKCHLTLPSAHSANAQAQAVKAPSAYSTESRTPRARSRSAFLRALCRFISTKNGLSGRFDLTFGLGARDTVAIGWPTASELDSIWSTAHSRFRILGLNKP